MFAKMDTAQPPSLDADRGVTILMVKKSYT